MNLTLMIIENKGKIRRAKIVRQFECEKDLLLRIIFLLRNKEQYY